MHPRYANGAESQQDHAHGLGAAPDGRLPRPARHLLLADGSVPARPMAVIVTAVVMIAVVVVVFSPGGIGVPHCRSFGVAAVVFFFSPLLPFGPRYRW